VTSAVFFLPVSFAFFMVAGYWIWTRRHGVRFRYRFLPSTLKAENRGIQPYTAMYPKLTEQFREKFDWRSFYFLHTTIVEFRQFDGYSEADRNKIRHLLASVATQMTLFLPEACFTMIHTIVVYPKPYYSQHSKQYHKGETNPKAGMIVLSWSGIAEGIASLKDGLNLIIHEYAHALWIEHGVTSYLTFDSDAADHFQKVAMNELKLAAEVESHFFRNYGLTNFHEFIAVAAENFFERPAEFEKELPQVYKAMVNLYQQDPLRIG